tara:strand:+ start:1733 stop:2104 length:372 start_codon:yes stop_codon:yes gene_type:complete
MIRTGGDGLYSTDQVAVHITHISTRPCMAEDDETNRLTATFDPKDWDVNKKTLTYMNLIYTDALWMAQFRVNMMALGFSLAAVESIDYSEQGAQGSNYVDMDVGKEFVKDAFRLGLDVSLQTD